MTTKWKWISAAVLPAVLWSSVAMAFSDTAGDPAEAKIKSLQKDGILRGVNGDQFAPKQVLTYEQGIHLLVKAFNLNLDDIQFVKEPKASDYFSKVSDSAWYANDFVIAQFTLELGKDVNPKAPITREAYAHLLSKAIQQTGEYATILLYNIIEDENMIDPAASGSIQFLLNTKITKLDSAHKFRPKASITRSEAADMLYEARAFVTSHGGKLSAEPTPGEEDNSVTPEDESALSVEAISPDVNKVTLTVTVPHPGYGVVITGIQFTSDHKAIIRYKLTDPDPDMFYPMVLKDVKVSTYIDKAYTPVAMLTK
ncbi:S-layer homology domain-containing protein [Gorillibacterium sp. CAU 1737]|uniref:S-layer homology domain-containing protein n=1 Tax=Gorillibacterium sp. CAU 1737 TaxID=3140362 RepID=UPI00325FF3D0